MDCAMLVWKLIWSLCKCSAAQGNSAAKADSGAKTDARKAAAMVPPAASKSSGSARKVPDLPAATKTEPAAPKPAARKVHPATCTARLFCHSLLCVMCLSTAGLLLDDPDE